MKNLHIIIGAYIPNTAFTNRVLGLIKGIGEHNVCVSVFFLHPSKNRDVVSIKIPNVTFIYLWENCKIHNSLFEFLHSFYAITKIIDRDIPVIVYEAPSWFIFFNFFKKYPIYLERTEHPLIYGFSNNVFGRILYKFYLSTCRNLKGGIFAISPSLAEFFINDAGTVRDKVKVVNMIVDSQRFDGIINNPQSLYITYCGSISEYKDGVHILIKSFASFHQKYSSYKLRLIGGFMSDKDKLNLLNLVESLGLSDFIDFYGKISANEMPQLLANSKVLVLSRPNNFQAKFGFPTKLGEYLMTGVPVVVTDVGDLNLYLKDKESIVFAKPDSIEDFSQKLLWVIENYSEALKIASRGKIVAKSNFNYFSESQKIIDFLNL